MAAALVLIAIAVVGRSSTASEELVLLPGAVTLHGPEAYQRIIAHRAIDGELSQPFDSPVTYVSSDPSIAKIAEGTIQPVANGTATITGTVGDHTAEIPITVQGMDDGHSWSFRHQVQPILTKAGCNAGSCHGALAGKGGFKLSLRGYDADTDHHTITRQARGRRIELSDPGRSLVLAKPTGALPHKGGLRLDPGSLDYRILAEWISAGAAGPTDADAHLDEIEVLPRRACLQPGDHQRLVVRAHYSNGVVSDVTRWTKFSSTDETVSVVDDSGQVSVVGYGEGAVTAWFASKIATARVTSPYANDVADDVYEQSPKRNFIDELVLKQLRRLNLPPSPRATDAEFFRRAYVDVIGLLPTPNEVREFLTDVSEDKRDQAIESLLNRDEFVDYWTYKWSDLLLLTGRRLRQQSLKVYYEWIHNHVAANTPWDQLVREVVTARGSSLENGATNFYALHQDPETMSENVSQAFLGLSIGCAKCHNHPLEKWTNDQYYAMANMYSRVRAKGWGGQDSGDGQRTLFVVSSGELVQPLTGRPQPPAPLDGEALPLDSTEDRRVRLADWLVSGDNEYFSRSITNRIWANYFGVGLVEDVDDMRASNPASNEELLAAAAQYLVENHFDLKALMRVILQSETYQRSSQPLVENQDEKRFYSRYYPRRMMAEVLLDAISQATDVPTEFTQISSAGAAISDTDFYPKGTRALQLYDSAVVSYFLKTFGRNDRQITCECQRSDEPSIVQVLHISNGDTINNKLSAEGNRIETLLKSGRPIYAIIEEAHLATFSRYPSDTEMQELLVMIRETPAEERRTAIEDLYWSLMSSREFLFNH